MENAISINDLCKSYGKNRGVSNITFNVKEGDIFAFLGPNGAGKSTTIRSLMGFIFPDSGEIKVLGLDHKSQRTQMLKEIGYMPSEAMFYPGMTVSETIRFASNMRGMNCSAEAKKLCDRLGLDTNKKIRELSLGNRKKVSIVCAMQHRPRLFVFDEPTSGLDPLVQSEFFALIKEYVNDGATCFLSTHVLSEVKNHCRNVAIMKEGRLIKTDSVKHLTEGTSKKVTVMRDGELQSFLYKGDLNDFYKELQGHDIRDLTVEDPPLEDIFMHYYEN